jgi:hypothetical protein
LKLVIDQPTDRPTDIVRYRAAIAAKNKRTRQKVSFNETNGFLSIQLELRMELGLGLRLTKINKIKTGLPFQTKSQQQLERKRRRKTFIVVTNGANTSLKTKN